MSRLLEVFLTLNGAVTATFLVAAWAATDWKARALSTTLLAALAGLALLRRRGFTRLAAAGYLVALCWRS